MPESLIVAELYWKPVCRSRTDRDGSDPHPDRSRVDLTTTLYGELRRLAAARMAGQGGLQTLQATALVHEAWLKLGGGGQPEFENRAHLCAAVAQTMRHILVDRARRRKRIRHGGGLQRVDLDAWNWEAADPATIPSRDHALLLLDEALEALAVSDPETVELVKLHYFAGLTQGEVAGALGMSERMVRRRLAWARAWLNLEIRKGQAA
ncbi:MAG: ECF-type sigma factor [Opitutaceae bacterium]